MRRPEAERSMAKPLNCEQLLPLGKAEVTTTLYRGSVARAGVEGSV